MVQELTKAEVHELLDRTYMISENVEKFLRGHKDVYHKDLVGVRNKFQQVNDLLLEAYQDLGVIMGEF